MDIHVSTAPKHLRVTQGMIEDLLWDPVMAAKVIMDEDLDAFQKVRLRYYWFIPDLEDSSGFSTGKTKVDWIYANLRAILLPDQHIGVIYQTFQIGKDTFWQYFNRCRAPIYRAQLGKMSIDNEEAGKANSREPSSWKQYYRNDSLLTMPAPNFLQDARNLASWRINTLLLEEWTKIVATSEGIENQLLGRVTRPCYNQNHPVWANHITRTATAELGTHKGHRIHQGYVKRVKRGDPDCGYITYSYKDYSRRPCRTGKSFADEYRIEKTLKTMRASLTPEKWRAEGLGLWMRSASGWYPQAWIEAAIQLGRTRNLIPMVSRSSEGEAA